MNQIGVLIADRFFHETLLKLQTHPRFELMRCEPQELSQFLKKENVQALIIRSRSKITEEVLNQFPHLKLILTCTSGFDHIDLQATQKRNITVMYTPDANQYSAAELTWALVLSCSKKLLLAHRATHDTNWNRDQIIGTELFGKTYGIIGLGRIGKRVAHIARAFGMRVMAFDPYLEEEDFVDSSAERVGLEELFFEADVVSLHVPESEDTYRMIHGNFFSDGTKNLILINTSRGSVLNEEEVFKALENNHLGALGLDVFSKEPLPKDSPLLSMKKVVLSPHIGANTEEAFQRASESAYHKIINFFETQEVQDELPPKATWYTQSRKKSERKSF